MDLRPAGSDVIVHVCLELRGGGKDVKIINVNINVNNDNDNLFLLSLYWGEEQTQHG